MYKKVLIIVMVILLLAKPAIATKGIGIGPIETNITMSPMEYHSFYVMLFNPSDTDSDVDLKVYCTNCIRDYRIFGNYIGKTNYTYDFVEVPASIKVEKNTSQLEGNFVEIKIRMPLFVKNQLTLPGNRTIAYYGLTSNINELDFRIVASAGDQTKVSVVSNLRISIKQNQASFFVYALIVSAIALIFYLAWKKLF